MFKACLAVAAGLANHVLCFRSVWEGSAQGDKGRSSVMPGGGGGGGEGGSFRVSGFMEWIVAVRRTVGRGVDRPVRASATSTKYGTTKEQLAWIALNARRNAELNPNAIYREPMTMDDYMASRMISHAVLAVRLRRAVRRCDGGHRVAHRSSS